MMCSRCKREVESLFEGICAQCAFDEVSPIQKELSDGDQPEGIL